MSRFARRRLLGAALLPCMYALTGCGNSEVGSIKQGPEGSEPLKSKTEGRFKETVPPPAARKSSKGKKDTADEGKETR